MGNCKCECDCDKNETINLLKEVNSGCKSATNSCEQVLPYVKDEKLKNLISQVNAQHVEIGDKCHDILNKMGEDEKDPPVIASAMSWFGTEMKLIMGADSAKIAGLMMDGCNMGIQSIGKYINEYPCADKEVNSLAKKLIKVEEDFMTSLKEYL